MTRSLTPIPPSPYPPISSSPRPRAFATTTALILLALFGTVTLLAMANLRTQVRRTTRDAQQAQLRQLLHAGHLLVADLPKLWNAAGVQRQTLALPLPPDLQSASVQITIQGSPDGNTTQATLTATYNQTSAIEQIGFTRDDSGWHATSLTPD